MDEMPSIPSRGTSNRAKVKGMVAKHELHQQNKLEITKSVKDNKCGVIHHG